MGKLDFSKFDTMSEAEERRFMATLTQSFASGNGCIVVTDNEKDFVSPWIGNPMRKVCRLMCQPIGECSGGQDG